MREETTDAMFCEHANEVPTSVCTCPINCYCKSHTCDPVAWAARYERNQSGPFVNVDGAIRGPINFPVMFTPGHVVMNVELLNRLWKLAQDSARLEGDVSQLRREQARIAGAKADLIEDLGLDERDIPFK